MLRPGSRLVNIEKSLNAYIHTQLVTGLGLSVRFPRQDLWNTLPVRWVQVDYLPMPTPRPTTRVRVGLGQDRELLVTANCLEQLPPRTDNSGLAGLYTLSVLADQVMDVFGPQAHVPIRDYATLGDPIVSALHFRRVTQMPVPVPQGLPLEQRNVSVFLGYAEEYV
jgi:hypothetical protein